MSLLEITTAKNCSVNCYPFCPQLKFREAYGDDPNLLSFENFKTVADSLPKDVHLVFSGFSEPFLNSRALDMIEYSAKQCPERKITVNSTLVGLRPADIDRIAALKLESFCLHLPEPNKIAQIQITQNYKDTLVAAITKLQIASFSVMNDYFISNERAGNCDEAPTRKFRGPFYCSKLIEPEFVMLPNCDVVLCCMDWTLRHKLGNLLHQTFDQIASGEEYKRISANRWHISGDTLCRSCKWATPELIHLLSNAKQSGKSALYRISGGIEKWEKT